MTTFINCWEIKTLRILTDTNFSVQNVQYEHEYEIEGFTSYRLTFVNERSVRGSAGACSSL